MSFCGRVYFFKGWYGERHFMTAKRLYKRVMKDASISDFGWIASATELVRICDKPNFPQQYAHDIKIAILNCFAKIV